jgi:hypothetical protein
VLDAAREDTGGRTALRAELHREGFPGRQGRGTAWSGALGRCDSAGSARRSSLHAAYSRGKADRKSGKSVESSWKVSVTRANPLNAEATAFQHVLPRPAAIAGACSQPGRRRRAGAAR